MRWRLLPFTTERAAMNMAIDEAVAEGVRDGRAPATIRMYRWDPSAVSIGCFQSIEDEVDLEECRRRGVDVVRRRTGGGAVFHDRDGEITYSVIAPEEVMGWDITASYQQVCGWVSEALSELGLQPRYVPINDIVVGSRKISGCAQTRREGVFLQHGTVLYSLDRYIMFKVLRVSGEKISDKGIASFEERVTSVSDLIDITMDALLLSLYRSFCQGKDWYDAPLTMRERERAQELAETRYSNKEWTFSR